MKVSKELLSPHELGQTLQQGRLLKDLSQRELAQKMDVSQKWIWEMEQGKPGILMERLFKMLKLTGVKLYAELDLDTSPEEGQDD